MEVTLTELAERLNATLTCDAVDETRMIRGINALAAARGDELTFVASARRTAEARRCGAGALLVAEVIPDLATPQLCVANVDQAVIDVLNLYAPPLAVPEPGIHPTAVIADGVCIGPGTCVGPHVHVERDVRVGEHCILGAGCFLGQGSEVGDHTRLDAHVTVYHGCVIGSHVRIQANTTIGAVGFGYAWIDGAHRLVPHNGGVIIEDHVDIGANCCIDRAKFSHTMVGTGTKIDNLVQIGHNVVVGKCCLLSAQSGVAGSTVLGDGVVLAGQSGVADNLSLADRTTVGAKAGVMKSVRDPGKTLHWTPAMEQKEAMRVFVELHRLPDTMKRLRRLIERLDAPENDQG